MSLSKFCSFWFSEALHFSLVTQFEDRVEGFPPSQKLELLTLNEREHLVRVREEVAVNCWHAAEHESAAMWKMYCSPDGEGVAIKSTVGRLKASFRDTLNSMVNGDAVHIGMVKYSAPANWSTAGEFLPVLQKRVYFESEKELRAVIRPSNDVLKIFMSYGRGVPVPVDKRTLVEEVRVSPLAPEWFLPVVVRLNTGLRIARSDIAYH